VGQPVIELYIKIKMSKNNKLNLVGDNKVSKYQIIIIAIGVLLVLLFSSLSVIYKSADFLFVVGFIIVFFSILILFYSKLFSIKYDKQNFYIQNIFAYYKINSSEYRAIKPIKFVDFLYKIKFDKKTFLFIITSDDFFKNFFRSKKIQTKEIEQKIIQNLKINHNLSNTKNQTD